MQRDCIDEYFDDNDLEEKDDESDLSEENEEIVEIESNIESEDIFQEVADTKDSLNIENNFASEETLDITSLEDEEVLSLVKEIRGSSVSDNISNVELFDKLPEGEYLYEPEGTNARATGSLGLNSDVKRDNHNQREAGGEYRRDDDDGGHLIGNRFGGTSDAENLFAQNRNLNRGGYKKLENEWSEILKDEGNVYVDINATSVNNVSRPDSIYGYYISEDNKGNRKWDAFSFPNESKSTQEEWDIEEGYEINDYLEDF